MRKEQIRFITEISIFTALGLALDFVSGRLCGFFWPNGGSITLAFIPIFIMGLRHGLKGGLLAGFLVGVIQLIWSEYKLNFGQVCLDYIVPNLVLGIVGFKKFFNFKGLSDNIITVCFILIACMLRTVSLTLSGILFWEAGFLYSIVYNSSYTALSFVLCAAITLILWNSYFKKKNI